MSRKKNSKKFKKKKKFKEITSSAFVKPHKINPTKQKAHTINNSLLNFLKSFIFSFIKL